MTRKQAKTRRPILDADGIGDVLEELQDCGLDAHDLRNAVKDEKSGEAAELVEDGLLAVLEYLASKGWTRAAIIREAESTN